MAFIQEVVRSVLRGELRDLLRSLTIVTYEVIVNADNGPYDTDNPFNWFVTQTA